jgi:hypothetical protein
MLPSICDTPFELVARREVGATHHAPSACEPLAPSAAEEQGKAIEVPLPRRGSQQRVMTNVALALTEVAERPKAASQDIRVRLIAGGERLRRAGRWR